MATTLPAKNTSFEPTELDLKDLSQKRERFNPKSWGVSKVMGVPPEKSWMTTSDLVSLAGDLEVLWATALIQITTHLVSTKCGGRSVRFPVPRKTCHQMGIVGTNLNH